MISLIPNQRFKHIELEILTQCDCACFGCDRMSDVASKGVPKMSLEQVKLFVNESLAEDWEWERIRLLGGEPTLHPQFREMIEALILYRQRFPKVFLQVLTNGLGKANQYRDWLRHHKVDLHAEAKTKGVTPLWFSNTRIVPIDRDPNVEELEPCGIFGLRGCGLGLTNYGYFLDGAGATIARVCGYDIGVMQLKDVTYEKMLDQAKVLCRICGHWNPTDKVVTQKVTETGEVTGTFWTEQLRKYNLEKPKLRIYGEN